MAISFVANCHLVFFVVFYTVTVIACASQSRVGPKVETKLTVCTFVWFRLIDICFTLSSVWLPPTGRRKDGGQRTHKLEGRRSGWVGGAVQDQKAHAAQQTHESLLRQTGGFHTPCNHNDNGALVVDAQDDLTGQRSFQWLKSTEALVGLCVLGVIIGETAAEKWISIILKLKIRC